MTALQRQCIEELRAQNYPYSFIAKAVDMPMNTVKSICRRKNIEAHGPRKTKAEKQTTRLCKNCRRPIGLEGRVDRLFCSDSCRMDWWKTRRKIVKEKA